MSYGKLAIIRYDDFDSIDSINTLMCVVTTLFIVTSYNGYFT